MKVETQVDLTSALTFHVPASASHYVEIDSDKEVREALIYAQTNNLDILVLGGGSNMLFHNDFNGLVIKISSRGIAVLKDDGRKLEVVVEAGEIWHDFVLKSIDNGWGGLENLALIPGCVGASPMQNIGAYGVDIKEVLSWVEAIEFKTGELKRFSLEECQLGYRDSIFKGELKGKWVIVRVAYNLDRESSFKTSYGAIENEISGINKTELTHRDIANAVIKIRNSRLPNPDLIGNAGSFFKNPVVSKTQFNTLKDAYPLIPAYPQNDGGFKLAAGWLIDTSGWKGHDRGTHGVYEHQALVLVNKGGATGKEVWALALDIIKSVKEKYNIQLEPEVNQIAVDTPL